MSVDEKLSGVEGGAQPLDQYLVMLGNIGVRTTRHASELFECPSPHVVREVGVALRRAINEPYAISDVCIPSESTADDTVRTVRERYWDKASLVDVKHGAHAGFTLDDYFTPGQDRDAETIMSSLAERYPLPTVTRSLIDGIEAYMDRLNFDAVDATRIMVHLMQRAMPILRSHASTLINTEHSLPANATMQVVRSLVNETVPRHISAIQQSFNMDHRKAASFIAKDSLYELVLDLQDDKNGVSPPLIVEESDAIGVIDAYTLQTRPYSRPDLAIAARLASLPRMQVAFLRMHEALVDQGFAYLSMHPERAQHGLEQFSELFVQSNETDTLKLLPNPKLIKAFVNNILPAIGQQLHEPERLVCELSAQDIVDGVAKAQKMRLFQLQIGQFNKSNAYPGMVELGSFFPAVCPGNTMFLNKLQELLPVYYEAAA